MDCLTEIGIIDIDILLLIIYLRCFLINGIVRANLPLWDK